MNLPASVFGALRPRTVLVAVEVTLAVALAAQGARLVWTVAAPMGPLGHPTTTRTAAAPANDLSILARFDPFFRLPEAASGGEATGSGGGFTLFGVRAGAAGKGSAILGDASGGQKIFDVGDEVEPGVVLTVVGRDHVMLSRGGARQRLDFPQPSGPSAAGGQMPAAVLAPAPPPPSAAAAPAASATSPVDPQKLLGQAGLLPRMKDGRPDGYRVLARGGSDVLRTAGLQSGDVLLSVDGVGLTPERISELPQTLSASSEAELRFERGGQIMTTRVRMSPR